jgi:hypothetical protein
MFDQNAAKPRGLVRDKFLRNPLEAAMTLDPAKSFVNTSIKQRNDIDSTPP